MKRFDMGFVIELGIMAIGCIGYGLKCRKEMKELSEKIDKSIDEIEKETVIDVSEDIVEKAAGEGKPVAKKTTDAVNRCVSRVIVDVEKDLYNQVKSAMTKKYESMEASVTREIERQIKDINIDSVRDEVIEKAKEAASEKFNDSLEDVLNEFKERLNSVTKVYKSIEETFSSKASGDKAIKLVV